jgi:hypothetical protein
MALGSVRRRSVTKGGQGIDAGDLSGRLGAPVRENACPRRGGRTQLRGMKADLLAGKMTL